MRTRVDQIADRIYRLSTWFPEIGPGGFTFNQFLVDAEEPLLYHTGMRQLFPLVKEAVEWIMPVRRLRWIAFAHLEADECGAVNEFLSVAPHALLRGSRHPARRRAGDHRPGSRRSGLRGRGHLPADVTRSGRPGHLPAAGRPAARPARDHARLQL